MESDATDTLEGIETLLREGMALAKCCQCGCMADALSSLSAALPGSTTEEAAGLLSKVERWSREMLPVRYACLGCAYCYGAEVVNALDLALPRIVEGHSTPACASTIGTKPWPSEPHSTPACASTIGTKPWPSEPGEYHFLRVGHDSPVVVSTLASADLADRLAELRPQGLSLVGKTETENIGIDKVIRNVIANPYIRYLIVAGLESAGHLSGATLLALAANGVDSQMRVIDSPGRKPVMKNVTSQDVSAFRQQVQTIGMVGCDDPATVAQKITELTLTQEPAPT